MNLSNEEILEELKTIKKILTISNSEAITEELGKICDNNERKKVWVLINGTHMTKDIEHQVDMKIRAVDRFVAKLVTLGWVHNPRRLPPNRIINYVPPEWIQLLSDE